MRRWAFEIATEMFGPRPPAAGVTRIWIWRESLTANTLEQPMTRNAQKPSQRKLGLASTGGATTEYRVGPGCPPREHQFKPGQSGNPQGARKRPPTIAPDLKILLQAALGKKIAVTIGDKERLLTRAAAGIEQLVEQFARGDRYARRDLLDLADKLGLDLGASSKAVLEELASKSLAPEDEALVADFLKRNTGPTKDAFPLREDPAQPTQPGDTTDEEATSKAPPLRARARRDSPH
jgi:hypothetical protein